MKQTMIAILALGALAGQLQAQDFGWTETRFHRVHLRNGNFVDGSLVKDTNTEIVLKLPSGELGIRKDQVARDEVGQLRIEFIKMRTYREPPPLVKVKPTLPATAKRGEGPVTEIGALDKSRASDPSAEAPAAGEELLSLLDRLKKCPPEKKPDAVQAILARGREGALLLAFSLADLDATSVANAAFALGAIKEPETLPILRKQLSSPVAAVRCGVVETLGAIGDPSDLKRLRPLLADPDSTVRTATIASLGKFQDRDSFDDIVRSLVDPDAAVRKQALTTLGSLAGQFDMKDSLDRALSDALQNSKGQARIELIRLAGQSHAKGQSGLLIRFLSDEDPEVRAHVITALADMDARDAVDPLLRQMQIEREYWPRIQLAAAADKMKLTRAIETLIAWLGDRDTNIQTAASRGLRGITGQNLGVNQQAWASWWTQAKR